MTSLLAPLAATSLLAPLAATSLLAPLAAAGPAITAPLGLVVGLLIGAIHFGSLWWTARAYAGGGLVRPLVVHVLRFVLTVAVLVGLARIGAVALLAGALGLVVARALVVRRVGRTP